MALSNDQALYDLLRASGLVVDPSKLPSDARIDSINPVSVPVTASNPISIEQQDTNLLNLLGAAGLYPSANKLPRDVTQPLDRIWDPILDVPTVPEIAPVPEGDPNNIVKRWHSGADRVNAGTGNHGIRAVVGEDGKVTLTNVVGADPMAYSNDPVNNPLPTIQKGYAKYDEQGNGIGEKTAPVAPTESQNRLQTNVHGLLNMMKTAKDANELRGIQAQFTQSVAAEETKMLQNAYEHASKVLGIPQLEQALTLSQMNDVSTGLTGESPATQKLRAQIEQSRSKVDNEAKRLMSTNITFNSLQAAKKTAEAEGNRLLRLEDSETRLALNNQAREDNRRAILQEQADGLTDEVKKRMRMLDPAKADADDIGIMQAISQHKSKDGFVQALEAPDEQVPLMAASGNVYAKAILLQKEKAAGVDEAVTTERLKQLNFIANNPKEFKKAIRLSLGGTADEKAIEAQMATINAMSAPGSTQKAQALPAKLEIAKTLLGEMVYNEFKSDVSKWGVTDPAIQAAIEKTREAGGTPNLQSVLAEYTNGATGPARRVMVDNFLKQANVAASRTEKSALGAVDFNKLRTEIETEETQGLLAMIGGLLDLPYKMGSYAADQIFNNKQEK